MSTSHLRFTTLIDGPAGRIFDLLADMPGYGRWLPGSEAFGGTRDVTPYPVQLGTRYLDYGPAGERPGVVTEYDRPHLLGFHQTMQLKLGLLDADIDVRIRYTLTDQGGTTLLVRELALTINIKGILRIMTPFIRYKFKVENLRLMAAVKCHIEQA